MTASLLSLPDEVLAQIIEYLDVRSVYARPRDNASARPSHVALALTCHRLSHLVRDSVTRDLEFALRDHQHVQQYSRSVTLTAKEDQHRIELLMRTWFDRPELLNRVKTVTIGLHRYSDATVGFEFLSWLSRSTSLFALGLYEATSKDIDNLAFLFHNRKDRFVNLKRLSVIQADGFKCSPEVVYSLCMLPSLERITIRASITARSVAQGPFLQANPDYRYPVVDGVCRTPKQLVFPSWQFETDVLEYILPSVTVRTLVIPHLGAGHIRATRSSTVRKLTDNDRNRPYSPARLNDMLAPARENLEFLKIGNSVLWYYYHDNTKIDLSAFTKLRIVHASSSLLFGPTRISKNLAVDNEVWRLLPRSVEDLHVLFDGVQGLFWSVPELDRFRSPDMLMADFDREVVATRHNRAHVTDDIWTAGPGSQSKVSDALSWLTLIFDRKQTHFPQLKSVHVVECHDTHVMRGAWKSFDLLSIYPTLFAPYNVQISVSIYVPADWDTASLRSVDDTG
ncbi:hypothetical protein OHC33_003242 [Knufia fluminis]|uniref:F-box domain-containing protein n=1 Tax=Knufia fluminis TaxID=191047 RepID=A0AAN8FC93_9EURO|nr:hypothetical protein OHC33_003242 [Knufia fluminis]